MRSRQAKWFETKIRYEKMMEDGQQKRVTELYVVDSLSFSETERRITEEMSNYISGEFEVADIKPAAYKEVFFSDVPAEDCWFKAKLQFITLDEKSGKEKRSTVNYLVQGATLQSALKNVNDVMGTTMVDYVVASLSETKIMDVYEYVTGIKEDGQKSDDKPEFE